MISKRVDMQEIKKKLETKKNEIEQRLQALLKDKRRYGEAIPQDFSDQAQMIENDEVIDSLDKLEREELSQINEALKKLENGSYGVCINCNSEISINRLRAMPYALLCIDCTH